jgi:hypothetical protein
MAYRLTERRTCAVLVCVSLVTALGGCQSDGSSGSGTTASAAATSSATGPSVSSAAQSAATAPPVSTPVSTSSGSAVVTSNNSADACLPVTMPTADALFSSTRKVFAHYFESFPLSIDNEAPADDYYNREYLAIDGESGKWEKQGGFLRQRPLGTTPSLLSNWQELNMEAEIRTAIARGITGFTFDVMSTSESTGSTSQLQLMLAAATAVDSRFKIVVMPDISALGANSAAVVQIIASVAASPAAYRLSDGQLVVSAFDAGLESAAWWSSIFNTLSAQGIKVAFVPTFLGWNSYAKAFASISYGFADWGTATASAGSDMLNAPETAHTDYGKIFMMPVDPQQYRPKDFLYQEAGNSEAFRNAWTSAIQGDSDWIQLVTWSDFSESSEVQPYTDSTLATDIGTGYYDLNGYYAAWFLTQEQPAITHDVLYYFYRREPTNAAGSAQSQLDTVSGGAAAENDIELLAFLIAPGELQITIGGHTYTQSAPAGVTSFKVPSQAGTPVFALSRNGADVFSFNGGVQIYGTGGLPSKVQDLTYWSGSASQSGVCAL